AGGVGAQLAPIAEAGRAPAGDGPGVEGEVPRRRDERSGTLRLAQPPRGADQDGDEVVIGGPILAQVELGLGERDGLRRGGRDEVEAHQRVSPFLEAVATSGAGTSVACGHSAATLASAGAQRAAPRWSGGLPKASGTSTTWPSLRLPLGPAEVAR